MSRTYQTQITIDVTVHYVTYPFRAGSTDGRGGPKLEPDEPAEIVIEWVEKANGKLMLCTVQQYADLKDEIAEHLSQEHER